MIREIWEVENWGRDEWGEQVMAELVFAQVMNIQFVFERDQLDGYVACFRVRCARNGFVLVHSDGDEDIFVAVSVERTKPGARARVLGWLRGSEAKLPQFYQNDCWVIPPEALHNILHDMEKLPGKERLLAMPPYKEDLNGLPTHD
jgi:hypothetical protein